MTPFQREQLIVDSLPAVRALAGKIHRRLPPSVEFNDVYHAGVLGLVTAIDRFDPSRGVPLWGFAEHRVKGAILDSLRTLDGLSRVARKLAKAAGTEPIMVQLDGADIPETSATSPESMAIDSQRRSIGSGLMVAHKAERRSSPKKDRSICMADKCGHLLSQHTPYCASCGCSGAVAQLTGSELEIIKKLALGLVPKEIAVELRIAPKTVEAHKYNLMKKLDLHATGFIILFALKNKLISLDDFEFRRFEAVG